MTIHPSLDNRKPVSHGKFIMLRSLIAMAHADGSLTDAEKEYISAIFARLKLTEDQLETLHSDFENPQNFFTLLTQINDPSYRSQALYFARLLAFKDGQKDLSEEAILNKLQSMLRENVDMEQIREDVHRVVTKELAVHDAKMQAIRPQGLTLFGILDKILLAMNIDLLAE